MSRPPPYPPPATALPARSSSRSARLGSPAPATLPASPMLPRESPLQGLPPLLVPAAHGPLPPTPHKTMNGTPNPMTMDGQVGERVGEVTSMQQGLKRFDSPLRGVPALLAPVGNDTGEFFLWDSRDVVGSRKGLGTWCVVLVRHCAR